MKIKKFTASSMPEAMKLIKEELGNDAIILNSKEVKASGVFGLFKRKKIEVTAAVDREPPLEKRRPRKIETNQKKATPIVREPQAQAAQAVSEERILGEIKHLHELIKTQSFQSEHNFPPEYEYVWKYLLDQEVTDELALQIVNALMKKRGDSPHSQIPLKQLLRNEIEAQIENVSFQGIDANSHVIQFVGPTGVGKTTTLAKVAAQQMLENNKKIAFITADTYRIAAIEQLKTYAKILNVPVEVVYSLDDYQKAINKFMNYDLIFVDTAGRNYREMQYVQELQRWIETPTTPKQTFLVLSLTAKMRDIVDIYEQFKPLTVDQLIFTKIDETESYGSLLNICARDQIGIAYLTNGQNVPDDLLIPSKSIISELIVRGYANE